MSPTPWQLQLIKRSIKKREKLRLLQKTVAPDAGRSALEVGCAQGILSYFLRRKGGFWVSTDQDWVNLKTSQAILEKNLVQTGPTLFPFRAGAFDLVTCLDYLEHVDNDRECLQEMRRMLKPGGEVILVTPHTGKFFILHKLRAALGMKLEDFGHKREGYGRGELQSMMEESGFEVCRTKTYSRFFSEFLELLLNFIYTRFFSKRPASALRDGHIRPSTAEEYRDHQKKLRLYSMIYPFIWLVSRLDVFIFFLQGYSLMIWAKKKPE
ncbi:MAG: methyltransferase domain-containing protein [Acidobacteriota bacterium]|nr:methyltransferase domain-containing protein [Acidobacteriota bacterium]